MVKGSKFSDLFDAVIGVDLDVVEIVVLVDAVTFGLSSKLLLSIKLNKTLPSLCDFVRTKVLHFFPFVQKTRAEQDIVSRL